MRKNKLKRAGKTSDFLDNAKSSSADGVCSRNRVADRVQPPDGASALGFGVLLRERSKVPNCVAEDPMAHFGEIPPLDMAVFEQKVTSQGMPLPVEMTGAIDPF